jgi:hypothetical protein
MKIANRAKDSAIGLHNTHGARINSDLLILGIEITTILVVLGIAQYITKRAKKSDKSYPSTAAHGTPPQIYKYYFITVIFAILIIHNLVIGGWHGPKDLIFIGLLVIIGVWGFKNINISEAFTVESNASDTKTGQHKLQKLGQNDMDYNLPEAGRDNSSPELVGTDLVDAHPEIDDTELVWGNRPEHYDFTPDDIPTYLELESLRKLKSLKKKVRRDKNYKYIAQIKPYDAQSAHRPESGDMTTAGQGLLLHRQHGLDNIFLENADKHKAYGMPKEVLDALSNSPYGVWKEGTQNSKDVKSQGKYQRNNGVPGSWYKFLNEPEPTLTPGANAITCNTLATTTTRPDGLKTSPDSGAGPVAQTPEIADEMIAANNKFRTTEYFSDFTVSEDSNQYSLYSDAINQRMPGCSDKISQYTTNYPLVSQQSLDIISNNCARRLDGSCPL